MPRSLGGRGPRNAAEKYEMPRNLGGRVPRPICQRSSAACDLCRKAACRPNFLSVPLPPRVWPRGGSVCPSQEATAELLSAGTSSTSSPKGQTNHMRELVQIDSLSEHACGQPSVERWQVLEPVSGRWAWMRGVGCCSQVVVEPGEEEQEQKRSRSAA